MTKDCAASTELQETLKKCFLCQDETRPNAFERCMYAPCTLVAHADCLRSAPASFYLVCPCTHGAWTSRGREPKNHRQAWKAYGWRFWEELRAHVLSLGLVLWIVFSLFVMLYTHWVMSLFEEERMRDDQAKRTLTSCLTLTAYRFTDTFDDKVAVACRDAEAILRVPVVLRIVDRVVDRGAVAIDQLAHACIQAVRGLLASQ